MTEPRDRVDQVAVAAPIIAKAAAAAADRFAVVPDDVKLFFGSDGDAVVVKRTATLNANTALDGVFVGVPVVAAIPADSLIIANATASGDIVLAANRGGNSESYVHVDASAGQLILNSPNAAVSIGAAMVPTTNDGGALGSTSLKWSDLWLASGGVIDFNSGDVTITHSANDIAVSGGTLTTSGGVAMGAATAWTGTPTFTGIPSFIGASSGAVTAALLHGGGTSATPCATATADKNFLGYWTKSTAATGDCRGMYLRTYFGGAGSGEALRAYATVDFAGAAAVGGTINGMHCSLSIAAGSTISGQAFAARFTLDYATATRTTDANVCCVNLDSNIGANNTVHANNAFLRLSDTGSVPLQKFLRTPAVASAGLLAAHITDALTHSIRCVDEAGTVFYIMCTTTASNRTGGA